LKPGSTETQLKFTLAFIPKLYQKSAAICFSKVGQYCHRINQKLAERLPKWLTQGPMKSLLSLALSHKLAYPCWHAYLPTLKS